MPRAAWWRLATRSYLYYRHGPYKPLVPKEVFAGDVAAILGPLMATTGTDKAAQDTSAFIAYLDTRADVAGRRFGAVGFCMGGGLAIAAAAHGWMVPDFPVHDPSAADRGWQALRALFNRTLNP